MDFVKKKTSPDYIYLHILAWTSQEILALLISLGVCLFGFFFIIVQPESFPVTTLIRLGKETYIPRVLTWLDLFSLLKIAFFRLCLYF